jgi:hypothetical protein
MSPERIEKIRLIMQISFLAVSNTNLSMNPLPIDIYDQGIYSKEQRGKEVIKDQESTRNDHRGNP